MSFGKRLREKRNSLGLSQQALAEKAGVTARSIQNYESEKRYPNSLEIAARLAEILNTTSEYLLSGEEHYLIEAQKRGGASAKRDIEALIGEVGALFAGGELEDDEKDAVMQALTEAYWIAKNNNKKRGKH